MQGDSPVQTLSPAVGQSCCGVMQSLLRDESWRRERRWATRQDRFGNLRSGCSWHEAVSRGWPLPEAGCYFWSGGAAIWVTACCSHEVNGSVSLWGNTAPWTGMKGIHKPSVHRTAWEGKDHVSADVCLFAVQSLPSPDSSSTISEMSRQGIPSFCKIFWTGTIPGGAKRKICRLGFFWNRS